MKKIKPSTILCIAVILVLIAVIVIVALLTRGGVAKEYQYNTEIISLDNAPDAEQPQVESITGFVEDKEQTFLQLPYQVEDTCIEIISVGKYTGKFTDNGTNDDVKDVLAIVITNTSDKVISYSSVTFEYANDLTCTFSPTNIPAHQSALVLTTVEGVPYKNIEKLECVDNMIVLADKLQMLEGTVGVDYKDGEFIVTNLTNKNLGDVYIRYKNSSDGNAYLGGITLSEVIKDVEPYETYKVEARDFDPETSVIVSVENIVSPN